MKMNERAARGGRVPAVISPKWWIGLFRRADAAGYFIRFRDLWLFIISARTDSRIAHLRARFGNRVAFETLYRESTDPWHSMRFRYQNHKYEVIASLLPPYRRYRRVLDLGCGLGALSGLLSVRADYVLGVDVAQSAVDRAIRQHGSASVIFQQGDILAPLGDVEHKFDLIAIVDVLYYLPNIDDVLISNLADKIAEYMDSDGLCLLTNHFFFPWDKQSRLSKRIHAAFLRSSRLTCISQHWRPFYLTTLLTRRNACDVHA
jgi:SAM-dependent methyltransferase